LGACSFIIPTVVCVLSEGYAKAKWKIRWEIGKGKREGSATFENF
jgi:hypothetical protein